MKLLVDCHCFDSSLSQGITTYVEGIYKKMPAIAKDIDFYFVSASLDKIKSVFGEANNIHYLPLTSKNRLNRLFFEIPNLIKKHKIDIAHFQYVSPLIKNCKTIVTLHDILFIDYPQYFPLSYRLFKGLSFKLSAKRADLLCTVSEYSRLQIHNHYGIEKDRIVITPNAVAEEFYLIEEDKPSHFPSKYILYVSRIEPRKNHLALINAFQRMNLATKGYTLVLIGRETVSTPELHNAISNLPENVKSKIIMMSQASFSDLKLWYKYADLFIYPTVAEGFGIPPIEAGAARVPVICNNSTAMADFSFFKENLIDISNIKVLDQRIKAILSGELPNVDEICFTIQRQYNWQIIAENFNKALDVFRK